MQLLTHHPVPFPEWAARLGRRQVRRPHRTPGHGPSPGRGFTLVEVIATVVILAVIGSIASRTLLTAMDGFLTGAMRAQMHSELSIAMQRLEREIRRIPVKPDYGSVAPYIVSVTASSIAWVDAGGGSSSLSLSGSQVNFTDAGAGSSILLTSVTAFSIQTYDESGTLLPASMSGTPTEAIRRISIQISLQQSGLTETLRTSMFLRCTMEGAPT